MATNASATMFYDAIDNRYVGIGKNPESMMAFSSNSLSSEDSNRPREQSLRQISMSSAHVLMLHKEKLLYACPGKKKELFGTWVEGSDTEFNSVKLPENIVRIHQVLALDCGSLLLCTNSTTKRKEILAFGLKSTPAMGNKTEVPDAYYRLDYPEFGFE
jgi:hypothetical protein